MIGTGLIATPIANVRTSLIPLPHDALLVAPVCVSAHSP